ncbi:TspO/MBR family protein [Aurantiacibacter sediminis]|uniref:Tryptophan-rich sensory protein n=1 Tax=Aurantiacibacter sediminis TaxID=2793064 RepID=A0ABS0N4X3_9SPHN|nr:TspO/MBR family protein [Aurantiacibacter sediminis]MBH5322838.1 tryptophan-rich sensory protein [Aurantiacibacter sediminis]
MTFPLIFAIAWALILAAGGGLLTTIGEWYYDLKKPSWQPPDWLFGPAWTTIFALAAWAFVRSWDGAEAVGETSLLIALYVINGVANFVWSPMFFTLKRPDWALYEVPILWASVLALVLTLGRYDDLAPWLIVPYLAWVSFATVLNWKIVQLNKPFGGEA